jgi:DNA-binding transcriptional LysR family regulator
VKRVSALAEVVRKGLGAALLPRFDGEAMQLQRLQTVQLDASPAKLWLLTHLDLRRDAGMRCPVCGSKSHRKATESCA